MCVTFYGHLPAVFLQSGARARVWGSDVIQVVLVEQRQLRSRVIQFSHSHGRVLETIQADAVMQP